MTSRSFIWNSSTYTTKKHHQKFRSPYLTHIHSIVDGSLEKEEDISVFIVLTTSEIVSFNIAQSCPDVWDISSSSVQYYICDSHPVPPFPSLANWC
nr:Biomphalaria glabrata lysosome-associated membrane glycoprotein 5-like [Biomphalaria glabrata]